MLGVILFAGPVQAATSFTTAQIQALKVATKAKTIVLPKIFPQQFKKVALELNANDHNPSYFIYFYLSAQHKKVQNGIFISSTASTPLRLSLEPHYGYMKTEHPLCAEASEFQPVPSKLKHLKLPFQINGYCLKKRERPEKVSVSVISHFGKLSLSGNTEDLVHFFELLSYLNEY